MRTIKFRGKRVDNGEWEEGSLVMVCNEETLKRYPCIVISYSHDTFDWFEVAPNTICQFTGLTDKNGKDIWEGDTVKITWVTPARGRYFQTDDMWCDHELICSVEYCGICFVFVKEDGKKHQFNNSANFEVIGNIHDNN